MNNEITVIIPSQKFSFIKYIGCGDNDKCYLEEALHKIGIESMVSAFGETEIGGNLFKPREPFNVFIVEDSLNKGESITVTLVKQ